MSLINRIFLEFVSHFEIRIITQSIRIKNIDFRQHDSSKYVELNFYIRDKTIIDKSIIAHFRREIHVIDDLKVKILIDMNIIESETIDMMISNSTLHVESCDVISFITIKFKNNDERVNRIIRFTFLIIISPHTTVIVAIKFRDKSSSIDKNYFFHSISDVRLKSDDKFFVHIIDVNIKAVQIRNFTNQLCIISRNAKIDKLKNFEKKTAILLIRKIDIQLL